MNGAISMILPNFKCSYICIETGIAQCKDGW